MKCEKCKTAMTHVVRTGTSFEPGPAINSTVSQHVWNCGTCYVDVPMTIPSDEEIADGKKAINSFAALSNFVEAWDIMANANHGIATAKGFWDQRRNEGEALMRIVEEIAEGSQWLRQGHAQPSDHIPDYLGIEEELADAVIRIMDFGEGMGYRVADAVIAKMKFNLTRPYKHGKLS